MSVVELNQPSDYGGCTLALRQIDMTVFEIKREGD